MGDQVTKPPSQSLFDKFKAAAKELETDDDEARFDERMRQLMKQKPVPEKSE